MARTGKVDMDKGYLVNKYNQGRWNEAIDPGKRSGGRFEKKGPMSKVPRDAECKK